MPERSHTSADQVEYDAVAFLQFQVGGGPHTAALTREVSR